MAFADDVVISLTNQVIDWSSTAAGTFYTGVTAYSYFQDASDELGGVALAGSTAYPTPMSAATPQDFTVKDGWYLTQGSHKRTAGGSIQTSGYDTEVYLLTLQSAGYVNAVGSWDGTNDDLGKTVVGPSGTGILLDYDNTARKWWVRLVSGSFGDSEALTITSGTGAGTTESSSGAQTGEEGFANFNLLGTVNHWEGTYFVQGTTSLDPVTDGWYASAPTAAPDVLIKIQEAGTVINSGLVIVFNRVNRDLANSIDASTTGDTYDWFEADLSNFGRTPIPLNTRPDPTDTLTNTQAEDYLDGTTATIAEETSNSPYAVDVDQDGSTENYDAQVDQDSQTNEVLWSAFAKYFFRKGNTTTIEGTSTTAEQFRFLNASYAVTKDSPVGTIAGGRIEYARGWVPINVAAADASSYQVVDSGGTTVSPPVFFTREVSGLTSGQKVVVTRRSAPGFALLSEFTLAAGNNSGNGTLVLSGAVPADKPPTGFVRVFDDSGNEDRYAYTSFSGSTLTLSGTLSENYTSGNNAYIPYIDDTASGSTLSVALQYVADRDVVQNVRLGSGAGAILPALANYTISNADSSVPATIIADSINNN